MEILYVFSSVVLVSVWTITVITIWPSLNTVEIVAIPAIAAAVALFLNRAANEIWPMRPAVPFGALLVMTVLFYFIARNAAPASLTQKLGTLDGIGMFLIALIAALPAASLITLLVAIVGRWIDAHDESAALPEERIITSAPSDFSYDPARFTAPKSRGQ